MIDLLLTYIIPAKQHEANDGPEGFLWKESDHGGLVVLFPKKFKRQFKRVLVKRGREEVDRLYCTGFANGDRQHWRSNKSIASFGTTPLRVIAFARRRRHVWKIEDPSGRVD